MSKFNGMAIVACSVFTGTDVKNDKNGIAPVILTALAGKIPSKRILAGTIAKNSGFVVGNSYLVTFTEGEVDEEYGRQFNWANGGKATPSDALQFFQALGAGESVDVDMPKADEKPTTKANETLKPVANTQPVK